MRCKNCGWDNPCSNAKCEKCNAPLTGSVAETQSGAGDSSGEGKFDLTKTKWENIAFPDKDSTGSTAAAGSKCPECGYPVRAGAKKCPQCDASLGEAPAATAPDKKLFKGTVFSPDKSANSGMSAEGVRNGHTAQARKLVALLVTYSANPCGEAFSIYEGRNSIGRDAAADICIRNDAQISGKHLSILYRAVDRKFKFKDEQSINGTFVNDTLLDEGELSNLDVIRIGATRLMFMIIPSF
jgi:hypothetical protein